MTCLSILTKIDDKLGHNHKIMINIKCNLVTNIKFSSLCKLSVMHYIAEITKHKYENCTFQIVQIVCVLNAIKL